MKVALWFSDPPKTGHGRYNENLINAMPNALAIRYFSSRFGSVDTYPRETKVKGPMSFDLPFRSEIILNRAFQPFVSKYFFQSRKDIGLIHYTSQHERPFFSDSLKEIATVHDLTALKSVDSGMNDRIYSLTISRNIMKILELDDIIVNSNFIKREIMDLGYNGNIHMIHHCASPIFKPVNDKKMLRERLGIPVDKYVVLSVSSGSSRKNLGIIPKTMKILGKDFMLARVGPSIGAESEISFSGVNDNVLANLYAASDVLFFPSRAEGFGSPMVESLSSGLPVVASDIPITREVLGDAGIFAEKDDPFQYADLIRNSIMGADKEANKCLERSVEFSFDVFRKRYLNLYENLLGKTAPIEIR